MVKILCLVSKGEKGGNESRGKEKGTRALNLSGTHFSQRRRGLQQWGEMGQLRVQLHSSVHCSTKHNSQDLEATRPIDRGVDKEVMVHMGYYSAIKRNKTGSFVVMDLESVTQSKVSQKEKNKYILRHTYGI